MSDRHYVHHEDEIQLAKLLKESKPFLEKYGTTIIYAVAALMAIAAVFIYMQRRVSPTAEASNQLLLASTAEDYRDVADAFPNTPIGILSRLRQADRELEDAVSSMFTDRETALANLGTAEKAYKQLESRNDLVDAVRERVLVGLARVAECRCVGTDESIQAAVAAWEQVLKSFPESKTFKSIAESRIKRLGTTDCQEFYSWFSQQDPKPGDELLMPQDGRPGDIPSIPNFPSLQDLGVPAGHPSVAPKGSETSTDAETQSKTSGDPSESVKPAAGGELPAEGTPEESGTTPEPAADADANAEPPNVEAPADAPKAQSLDSDSPPSDAPTPEKSGE